MTILSADYLLLCDEDFTILQKSAICFDSAILEIATLEVLTSKYPEAKVVQAAPNSVVMPGLINPHVHLEFSANKTTLAYGSFIPWLESVIAHRDTLSHACDGGCIESALDTILASGTTTIGAISSFGVDMDACVRSDLNVVYFNEVLGSNPAAVDALFNDFLGRLAESRMHESKRFVPAISVHSPYSTHPILAKKALEISKNTDMLVSTHFMESRAEREWLDSGIGEFQAFFQNFAPDAKPMNEALTYIELFKDQNVLFTHATLATDEELERMNALGSITHCPVSNRLLGNGRLAIDKVSHLSLGTDGLSSNSSLSLWDEMRASLMMHWESEPNTLAQTLLLSATQKGATALKRGSGVLTIGSDADIISLTLPDVVQELHLLPLQLILHTQKAKHLFIQGEQIL